MVVYAMMKSSKGGKDRRQVQPTDGVRGSAVNLTPVRTRHSQTTQPMPIHPHPSSPPPLPKLAVGELLLAIASCQPPLQREAPPHPGPTCRSMAAVASSSTRMCVFLSTQRAMQISCFWPRLKLLPPSETDPSRPPGMSGRVS